MKFGKIGGDYGSEKSLLNFGGLELGLGLDLGQGTCWSPLTVHGGSTRFIDCHLVLRVVRSLSCKPADGKIH